MIRLTTLAAVLVATHLPFASVPAQERTAIRAGRLVDVERGEVRRDQIIVVRNGRIESITAAAGGLPAGAPVIDLSGYTVLPGLIDCHSHLIGDAASADVLHPLERSEAQEAFSGVRNARATLLAGFTTVRDIGTYRAFVDAALRDAITDGTVAGPRMRVAGAYVTVSTGGGELVGAAPDVTLPSAFRFGVANSADQVRERVRAILNGGADFIKLIATGAVFTRGTKPGVSEFTEEQIRAAVEQAKEYGTFVAAHAHGAEGIKRAVRAGVRSIEHGSLMDDEAIRLMKQHGTWLVADIWNGDYTDSIGRAQQWPEDILRKNTETTEAQRIGFRKAVAAGVRIAYGTDSGIYPHGMNAKQLPYMVKYGMTPMQAIQAATLSAAQLMQWEDSLGSLKPGKYADIIAVAGDALADLARFHDIAFVMKGGTVYKQPSSRDAERARR
ncbi:MAG TPA: amidohydrolase family protein [Gemmatimonadales bacterium]|nr:amidohydrolase family protein [Gemmatimonadales bacterium]